MKTCHHHIFFTIHKQNLFPLLFHFSHDLTKWPFEYYVPHKWISGQLNKSRANKAMKPSAQLQNYNSLHYICKWATATTKKKEFLFWVNMSGKFFMVSLGLMRPGQPVGCWSEIYFLDSPNVALSHQFWVKINFLARESNYAPIMRTDLSEAASSRWSQQETVYCVTRAVYPRWSLFPFSPHDHHQPLLRSYFLLLSLNRFV